MNSQASKKAFICEDLSSSIIGLPQLVTFACRYDQSRYSDDKFSAHGVPFSEKLNASVPKRRAEFLAGRYCAKRVLEQLNIVDQVVGSDEKRCPSWPAHVKGSISHNDAIAMAAITVHPTILGVGIDVETIVSEQTAFELEKQIIYGDEGHFFSLASASFATLFSLIFSIKESFFKAAFPSVGHYFGFEVVKVVNLDFVNHQFQVELTQDLNPYFRKGNQHTGRFSFIENNIVSLLTIAKRYE